MARNTRRVNPSNSLVASAARIGRANFKNYTKIAKSEGWHSEAWNLYRTVGEFRFAVDWVGSTLSKAVLHATKEVNGKPQIVTEGPAFELLDMLFGNSDGRAEMLRLIGIHLTVTGECWIVGWQEQDSFGQDVDRWEVASSTALKPRGTDRWSLNGEDIPVEADKVFVTRLWRPDPERPQYAISPTRAVLPILSEIVKLTEHVAAQVDSRLAGAGIFLVPSEMTFPAPPEETDPKTGKTVQRQTVNTAEDLMSVITEAMAAAIEDRGDPSALVPIVITAPADAIAAVKHITFWSELDAHAIDLRTEAIRRLALGMDMPPEVLQGVGESNHWSAWQADEAAIKSHTEPLLKIITSALAAGYLRPLLMNEPSVADEVIEHYSIMADTSEMRLRPNRSKEALELYELGELSGAALRRETGFSEDDAMGKDERITWFIRKVASGSTTPDLVQAALAALGVKLDAATDPAAEPTEARPAPSLADHPQRDIPDREVSESRKDARAEGRVPSATGPLVAAAADQIMLRALERAGNKLKNRARGAKFTFAAVDAYRHFNIADEEDLAFLLDDAWGQVPAVAARYGLDPQALTRTLDTYARTLLIGASEYSFDLLSDLISDLAPQEVAA